jgi:Ca-activated chloride channel family protein
VVVFKGEAATLMPLTEDVTAIEVALDNASPALVSAAGTDLSRGLEEAMARFPEGAAAHRAILLFSDGEALTGTLTSVLGRARREGIPILTVVAGTTLGAVVPSTDGSPMLDDDGRPVISRADSRTLGHVSETTGGTTHDLSDPNIVSELVDSLAQFADVRETEGFRLVPRRRYRLFLGLSLVALALSLSIRVVRWRDMF